MVDYKVTELNEQIDFGNLPYWDVVIIGAGPGGLAASLTTAHRGLTTLVVEAKDKAGGQPQFLYADKNIVDVPGFPDGIRGDELSNRVYRQAVNALVQFRFQEELVNVEETDEVEKEDRLKRVVTSRNEYLCRKVILACGLLHYPRRLPVLDALESKKVFYKIPKIGDYEGHGVAIVGGGDSAFDAAVMAIERGASVDVLCREEPIAKSDTVARVVSSGGRVHVPSEIAAAAHEGDAIRLTLSNDAELRADYVIVQIGFLSA
ncbi:MAG: NAD(P)/FAD-dependent oxidoreductase, partial [Pirellulales bacterium]